MVKLIFSKYLKHTKFLKQNLTILGENSIVIVLGSNALLSIDHVNSVANKIENAAVLLCQFETPLETTLHALKLHKGHG